MIDSWGCRFGYLAWYVLVVLEKKLVLWWYCVLVWFESDEFLAFVAPVGSLWAVLTWWLWCGADVTAWVVAGMLILIEKLFVRSTISGDSVFVCDALVSPGGLGCGVDVGVRVDDDVFPCDDFRDGWIVLADVFLLC
jgi:hypothetical protein